MKAFLEIVNLSIRDVITTSTGPCGADFTPEAGGCTVPDEE